MNRRALMVVTLVLAIATAGCSGVSLPATPDAGGSSPSDTATPPADAPDDPGVPADAKRWTATVTRVVDGDTVEVRYANGSTDTVRLVGVDTPETHGETNPAEFEGVPDTAAGRACLADAGERASNALDTWAAGATVTLVHDPGTDRRDRYDRLLAYVVRDGATLNYRLVARGHARVYDTPFTRAADYYEAEAAAKRAERGVWGCADPSSLNATDDLAVRVVADAPGDDNEHLNGEVVVLSNRATETRHIGDWTVSDEGGHGYAFPSDATIPANGSVRLYTGSGTDDATAYYWGADGAVWNNDDDTVTVRNRSGAVIVQRSY